MAFGRLIAAAGLCLALLGLGSVSAAAQRAPVEVVFATQSGEPAYDNDPFGGNPFASAFIAAMRNDSGDAGGVLIEKTLANSGQFQVPDVDALGEASSLRPQAEEWSAALVIVFADYGDSEGLISLPGAAFDALRVARVLAEAGYAPRLVVANSRAEYRNELNHFAEETRGSDRALIYTTGHGSEVDGKVIMLPPEADEGTDIVASSIMLDEVAAALQARSSNRLFYAGCRDNPLELTLPAAD